MLEFLQATMQEQRALLEQTFAQYSWISFLNVQFRHWMQCCTNVASSLGFANLLNLKEYAGQPCFSLIFQVNYGERRACRVLGTITPTNNTCCICLQVIFRFHLIQICTRPQRSSTFCECREQGWRKDRKVGGVG